MSTLRSTGPRAPKHAREQRSLRQRLAALLATLGLVAALSIAQVTATTEAAWQDREQARVAPLTAGLATPTRNTCGVTIGSLRASWFASPRASAVPITYSYRVLFANGDVAINWTSVDTSMSLNIALGLLAIGTYTLEIRANATSIQSDLLRARVEILLGLLGSCTWQ